MYWWYMAKKQLFNLYLGAINMMKRNTPLKLSYNEKIDITEKDDKTWNLIEGVITLKLWYVHALFVYVN